MIAEGHQIASHTWSHQNQSQLTTSQYKDQIIWNEIAIADVLGYFPTYMRFVFPRSVYLSPTYVTPSLDFI